MSAPQEADEVREALARFLWSTEAARTNETLAAFNEALDAFERAVEADLFRRAAVAAERFDLTDAKLPPHKPTETLLAEWMARAKAAEARLSRLEAAARAVLDDVDLITDLFSTRPAPLSVFDRLRAALKADGDG